jgi:glucose/mannose transport system substrate-binding protein
MDIIPAAGAAWPLCDDNREVLMKRSVLTTLILIAGLGTGNALAQPEVEVLHWWTSGGEARAVQTLMDEFQSNGGKWVDMPVAGGGGDAAMQALRARVLAGNAPTAVQLKGPSIQEWYEEGVLADLSGVGMAEKWDSLLPSAIATHMKCGGKYCAAPVNVHRVNWIWANTAVLARAGVSIPTTWDEFNNAAVKLKALGITPLAHGGQAWQDATVFESVVLGIGGPAFYKKALVDLDPASLNSPTMVKVFDQMRTLRGFVDSNFSGRDWNLATAMVINGEAAFQIMGDWAKGEFTAAGKTPGTDYQCNPTPGAGFLYNVDSFAMFKVAGTDRDAGQKLLAKLIVGENFQKTFNLAKGSIPARLGTSLAEFDY